jgi:hypothetical protein
MAKSRKEWGVLASGVRPTFGLGLGKHLGWCVVLRAKKKGREADGCVDPLPSSQVPSSQAGPTWLHHA